MTAFWEEYLKILGSTALLLGALAWLIKSLFSHLLSKDVELYKDNLKKLSELYLKEHEIRFSKLHERRAESIAKNYEQLQEAIDEQATALFRWNFDEEFPKSDMLSKAREKIANYLVEYHKDKIYFNNLLAEKIGGLIDHVSKYLLDLETLKLRSDIPQEELIELKERGLKLMNRSRQLFTDIEKEFREILGVT